MRSDRRSSWFEPFSLSPSSGRSVDALDGLRACAVVMIFMRHSWGLAGSPAVSIALGSWTIDFSPLIMLSSNGVDLFFVLSGYLLARRFIAANSNGQSPPDVRRYASARAYRILPGYFLAVAVLILIFLPALVDQSRLTSLGGLLAIGAHLSLLQTIFPFSYVPWGPASPYWTLSIEVLFYALLPWVVRAFYRWRGWIGLAASVLITFAWLTAVRWGPGGLMEWMSARSLRDGSTPTFIRAWLSRQLPAFAMSFGVGMFVAKTCVDLENRPARTDRRYGGLLLAIVGGVIVVASMWWLGDLSLRYQFFDGVVRLNDSSAAGIAFYYLEGPLMAIGFGTLLMGIVLGSDSSWAGVFRWKPLRLIGILGFAIYLWHMPFLYLYSRLPSIADRDPMQRWMLLSSTAGFAVAVVSLFSFFLVEKPMIVRGRRPARPSATRPATGETHRSVERSADPPGR